MGNGMHGVLNPTLSAKKNETVRITIVNGDPLVHDLALESLGMKTGEILGIGEEAELIFTAVGDDLYYCTIPGHREAGMEGRLEIIGEESGGGNSEAVVARNEEDGDVQTGVGAPLGTLRDEGHGTNRRKGGAGEQQDRLDEARPGSGETKADTLDVETYLRAMEDFAWQSPGDPAEEDFAEKPPGVDGPEGNDPGTSPYRSWVELLHHEDEHLRGWAIHRLVDDRNVPDEVLDAFADMARRDSSAFVQLQLASALQRIAPDRRWPVLEELHLRAEAATDAHLPMMIWYATEPAVPLDMSRALDLAIASGVPHVLTLTVRRIIAERPREVIYMLSSRIPTLSIDQRRVILGGINHLIKGN